MSFPDRLVRTRKEKGFTQQALSERAGVHVQQIKRYEGGNSQPTLEVIKALSMALSVSSDELLFDEHEREPDDDLLYQFEAIRRFSEEEKRVAKAVLDSLILKHEAKRLAS